MVKLIAQRLCPVYVLLEDIRRREFVVDVVLEEQSNERGDLRSDKRFFGGGAPYLGRYFPRGADSIVTIAEIGVSSNTK
uniref:Uncharacterized protein n=1 Tax=Candidatus Kentrum sp. LPFa TaxID=2126335 RepID=A0A450WEN2_9GAMM|nr:MAG: hypothetical protein BECKLPF1236B_GA0070989_107814 [Candidatus Kentron sp. LPFa]